jgi:thiamine-phosphate pyrophosphorylase
LKRKKIDFKLMVITDLRLAGRNLESLLRKAGESGVKCIHLREKHLSAAELLSLSKHIKDNVLQSATKLIINERLDIAMLSKAHGIHSTANGISAENLRKCSSGLIKGRSVHSISEAKKAEKDGFDYIMFGPVFRTPSKVRFGNPQGLDRLNKICSSVQIPVFAVGGITPARAKKCVSAGAFGVAAIRPFMRSKNIGKTILDFKNSLGKL